MNRWPYPSKKTTATYHVTHGDTGVLTCECRGWTNKRKGLPRECSHIKDVIEKEGFTREVRGDYVYGIVPSTTGVGAWDKDCVEPPDDDIIIPKGIETPMTTTTVLEPMKAVAITSEKYPKLVDADGYLIQAMFDEFFANDHWTIEEKLDGHRCIIHKRGSALTADLDIRTELRSIPSIPQHICRALALMPDGIYDGELLVPGGVSTDVPSLAHRDELVYVVFDLLEVMGKPTIGLKHSERRALLESAVAHAPDQDAVMLVAQFEPTWAVVQSIWDNGGEGVIVKSKDGKYRPGYVAPDWLKVKKLEHHAVTLSGFDEGSLGPTAVILFTFDDGTKGRCKNIADIEGTKANPDAYIGRRFIVECQQRTRGKKSPRHPRFDHWAREGE